MKKNKLLVLTLFGFLGCGLMTQKTKAMRGDPSKHSLFHRKKKSECKRKSYMEKGKCTIKNGDKVNKIMTYHRYIPCKRWGIIPWTHQYAILEEHYYLGFSGMSSIDTMKYARETYTPQAWACFIGVPAVVLYAGLYCYTPEIFSPSNLFSKTCNLASRVWNKKSS